MFDHFLVTIPLVVAGGDGRTSTLTMALPTELQREASLEGDLVVSADEQGSDNPAAAGEFACGFEFGPTPIPSDIVQGALDARKCDILVHRGCRDKRTGIRRGYFHATDDCEDCRSLLAQTIRSQLRERFFISVRWKFADARPDHPEGRELHQHVVALVLGLLANSGKIRRIIFRFERTHRSFETALRRWLDTDIGVRLDTMIRQGIPLNFAPVDIEEVSKSDHGTQVCDHLLWRERRSLTGRSESLTDAGMAFNHSNEHPPYKITCYQHGCTAFPTRSRLPPPRPLEQIPIEELISLVGTVEATVHHLARTKPPEVRHLERFLHDASSRTIGKLEFTFDDFVTLHVAFLTVVELHFRQPETSPEQHQKLADLLNLSMVVARQSDGCVPSVFDEWRHYRESLIRGHHAQFC